VSDARRASRNVARLHELESRLTRRADDGQADARRHALLVGVDEREGGATSLRESWVRKAEPREEIARALDVETPESIRGARSLAAPASVPSATASPWRYFR